MKTRKLIIRLAIIALIIAMASVCMVGGTLAKYTTSGSGTSTAQVAAWGITMAVDLDETFDTSTDTGVITAESTFYIAPGTSGSFTFGWSGTTEVAFALQYMIQISYCGSWVDENGEMYYPITFSLSDSDGYLIESTDIDSFYDDLFEIFEISESGYCETEYAAGTVEATSYTFAWEWAFDESDYSNDTSDTHIGELANYANIAAADEDITYYLVQSVTDDYLGDYSAGDVVSSDSIAGLTTSSLELPELEIVLILEATQLDEVTVTTEEEA